MRITKRQLRRIINEEALQFRGGDLSSHIYDTVGYDMTKALWKLVDDHNGQFHYGIDPYQKEQIEKAVDKLFSSPDYEELVNIIEPMLLEKEP